MPKEITLVLTLKQAEWLANVLLDVEDDAEEEKDRRMAASIEELLDGAIQEEVF